MDLVPDLYDCAEKALPPEQVGGGGGSHASPYRLSRLLVPTAKASPSSYAAAKLRVQRMQEEEPVSIDIEGPLEQPRFSDNDKENQNVNLDSGDVFGGSTEPSLDVTTAVAPLISTPILENALPSPTALPNSTPLLRNIFVPGNSPALSGASASLPGDDSTHLAEIDKNRDEAGTTTDDDNYSNGSLDDDDDLPRTPRGRPGRPSRDTLGKIEELFEKASALFEKTANETGRSVESLIQDWGHSVGSPIRKASNNIWNAYERYFADPINRATERKRVGRPDADSKFLLSSTMDLYSVLLQATTVGTPSKLPTRGTGNGC